MTGVCTVHNRVETGPQAYPHWLRPGDPDVTRIKRLTLINRYSLIEQSLIIYDHLLKSITDLGQSHAIEKVTHLTNRAVVQNTRDYL